MHMPPALHPIIPAAARSRLRPVMTLPSGKIVKCCISGDFFPLKDGLNEKLGHLLAEVEDNPAAIEAALEGFDATEYVVGLSTKALAEIIAGKIK